MWWIRPNFFRDTKVICFIFKSIIHQTAWAFFMQLHLIDLAVIGLFFLSMLVIGIMSYYRSKSAEDYFVAGGKLPWWLAGISHHVSGHSGAVFVAYAAVAFTHGFTIYVWWALPVGVVIIGAAGIFPVYWVRLRKQLQIQSPLEYLRIRYNLLTQQVVAWNGVLLKVLMWVQNGLRLASCSKWLQASPWKQASWYQAL